MIRVYFYYQFMVMAAVIGFLYSETSVLRGGSIGTSIMLASLFGLGMALVYKTMNCSLPPPQQALVIIASSGLVPMVIRHAFGYSDAKE